MADIVVGISNNTVAYFLRLSEHLGVIAIGQIIGIRIQKNQRRCVVHQLHGHCHIAFKQSVYSGHCGVHGCQNNFFFGSYCGIVGDVLILEVKLGILPSTDQSQTKGSQLAIHGKGGVCQRFRFFLEGGTL